MGLLDSFEKGLERAVNGVFAKTFRSGLQPVEIGSALKRELDTKAVVVSRERVLAPNSFVIGLAPSDYQKMLELGQTLIDDLRKIVYQHATSQNFQFAGEVSVELTLKTHLSTGVMDLESSNAQDTVVWIPLLNIAGKKHALTQGSIVIGRGHEADVTVDDSGISRKHLEISWDGKHARARDLLSTNGSLLEGKPFKQAILEPNSVIVIGRTHVIFQIVAQNSDRVPSANATPKKSASNVDGFWQEQ